MNGETKKMKTATWTYTDIKANDVNDLLISKNDKGELEMTFRTVVHNNQRAKREAKQKYFTTVICGTLTALLIIAVIGLFSWVNAQQTASLDAAVERLKEQQQDALSLELEKEAAREAEYAAENSVVYYHTAEDGVIKAEASVKPIEASVQAMTYADSNVTKGKTGTGVNEYKVPKYVDTSFKAYMDYRTITDTTSKQYEMQQGAWTGMDGVRRIGDDICVAMGTYYTTECGTRFEITLDTGKSFNVVVSDIKADKDTDETNRYTLHGDNPRACVIEFIVDIDELGEKSRDTGDVSNSNFKGEVVSIVKL